MTISILLQHLLLFSLLYFKIENPGEMPFEDELKFWDTRYLKSGDEYGYDSREETRSQL